MLYWPPVLFPQQNPFKCDQCREREAVAYDAYGFYRYCQHCLDLPREQRPLILDLLVYFKKSANRVA